MADTNQITYTDLVKPTDSITQAIAQMTMLETSYSGMLDKVKKDASEIEKSIRKVSGATDEQQEIIKKGATEVDKLAKAEERLKESRSDNAIKLAKLKQAQLEQNRLSRLEIKLNKSKIGSYDRISAQYSINKIRLNAMSDAQRESTKSGLALEKQTKALYEQMNKLQKATGKNQLQVGQYDRFSKGVDRATVSSRKLLATLGVAGGVGLFIRGVKEAFETARVFEKENAVLAGVLGKTRAEVTKLTKDAKRLGNETAFTATEVTQLQISLARLGKTEEEILAITGDVIVGTLALGSATAETAELVGATLNTFELGVEKSAHVVDVLTLSTQKSALNFTKLSTAIPIAAGAAAAANVPFEVMVAQLGQAVDRGIDASSAATSLRNIYIELAAKGLTLNQALTKINTSQDRLTTANELFGKRSAVTALALASTTERTGELTTALENAGGTAQRVANEQMATFDGQIKSASSAYEGLILALTKTKKATELVYGLGAAIRNVTASFKSGKEEGEELATSIIGVIGKESQTSSEKIIKYARAIDRSKESLASYTAIAEENQRILSEGSFNASKINKAKQSRDAATKAIEKETEAIRLLEVEIQKTKDAQFIEQKQAELKKKTLEELIDLQFKYAQNENILTSSQRLTLEALNREIAAREKEVVTIAEVKDVKKDLIKELEAERKAIKKTTATTIGEVALRNVKIKAIDDEIKKLKELGKETDKLKPISLVDNDQIKKDLSKASKTLKVGIEGVKKEVKKEESGDIYTLAGINLSDEKKAAISTSTAFAIDQVMQFMDAKVRATDLAVENSDREVSAAENALNREVQLASTGYASSVNQAQKELALAKSNQEKALKEQEKAQKAQEKIQTLQQISSLVTASAMIWGQLGFPFAIPALAVMFGSFAFAKIKSAQLSKQKQYGDGDYSVLQGGSHASGNDIFLGNNNGVDEYAEGGEGRAIFSRKSTRKYSRMLPDIVNSLNKGIFEKKYMRSSDVGGINLNVVSNSSADLGNLKGDVSDIRKQGERRYFTDGKGRTIEVYKNLKRVYVN